MESLVKAAQAALDSQSEFETRTKAALRKILKEKRIALREIERVCLLAVFTVNESLIFVNLDAPIGGQHRGN